jgi:hypothetical protein
MAVKLVKTMVRPSTNIPWSNEPDLYSPEDINNSAVAEQTAINNGFITSIHEDYSSDELTCTVTIISESAEKMNSYYNLLHYSYLYMQHHVSGLLWEEQNGITHSFTWDYNYNP